MPGRYEHFELRLEVDGPVAEESPFDSGTLWGRILCALSAGQPDERDLAEAWLDELRRQQKEPNSDFSPPLIISEGFPCDIDGEPWLPMPLTAMLRLQSSAPPEQRKKIVAVDRVPKQTFDQLCAGQAVASEYLVDVQRKRPLALPALQPHLSMDRYSGTGRDGLLFVTGLTVYTTPHKDKPQVLFYMKIKITEQTRTPQMVRNALQHICRQGWGHGKTRGLGRIRLKSFEPSNSLPNEQSASGFVSLSHFCPAAADPTDGHWWLNAKHPVPAPFLAGQPVTLGEESEWRVKSFLRLQAGSCLKLRSEEALRPHYGRTLSGLLDPAEDRNGNRLPQIFHYALSYPWPLTIS